MPNIEVRWVGKKYVDVQSTQVRKKIVESGNVTELSSEMRTNDYQRRLENDDIRHLPLDHDIYKLYTRGP